MLTKEEEYILQLIRSINQGEKKSIPTILKDIKDKQLDELTIDIMLIKLGIISPFFPNIKKHPDTSAQIAQQEFVRDLAEI